MFRSVNPFNEELLAEYVPHDANEVEKIVNQVYQQWLTWKGTSFKQRSALMHAAAANLESRREQLAMLMVNEMGKPVSQALAEIDKCAWVCHFYADNAERFLTPEHVETDATESFITYQPLGPVLAVMPWNFPFWQVFRFAAPALMAGNGALLKHASNVMGCAMAIEQVFIDAGFPPHIFRTLRISGEQVGGVIDNPLVKAVTLTGSVAAGSSVAEKAGRRIKKTVLELGGSDPYLVLDDADIEKAAQTCVSSRLLNGGQSCIAAKRFIIAEAIYDQFEKRFVEIMKSKRMGDPMDKNSDLGPMAQVKLRDELHNQVKQSLSLGAVCLLGGEIPSGKGAWYPPTVLANIKPGMPAYHEELFGPVASLIRAVDTDDAIRIANDSSFGLGAAVFTRDLSKGKMIAAEKLNAGCCFVNELVKSDPRLPFGGIEQSGYGRELSYQGIREFVNIKSVYIK